MEFLGNIITAIATVISVVIANKLSSSQSGQAKLWDLRRQTYGIILSELASIERLCDLVDSYMEENIHAYHASDIRTTHDKRLSNHMGTVRQRFSDDYLTVSDKFLSLFEAFISELDEISPDVAFPEDYELFAATIRKHRPLLLTQGRREMTVRHRLESISAYLNDWPRIKKK
jgi:hypothetical protein